MTMENYRTDGTPWFVATDPDDVVLQDGFVIDTDRFTRALGESGPAAPVARVAHEELDQPTSSRRPTPESDRWCSSR
jgi:hypothetical protein